METENSTVVLWLALLLLIAILVTLKIIECFSRFSRDTQYITTEMRRADDMAEYRYWRRELRCHYLCLIPFVTDRNVMRLYNRLYHKADRTGKTKRTDGLGHILAPSMIGVCICALCLSTASWAWFTASHTNGILPIQAATYTMSVTVNGQPVSPIQGKSHSYRLDTVAGNSYQISLSATGTASTGYAMIYYEGEAEKQYTEQIAPNSTLAFTLRADRNGILILDIQWGSCAIENISKIKNDTTLGEPSGITPYTVARPFGNDIAAQSSPEAASDVPISEAVKLPSASTPASAGAPSTSDEPEASSPTDTTAPDNAPPSAEEPSASEQPTEPAEPTSSEPTQADTTEAE